MIKTVKNISRSMFKNLNFYPTSKTPSKETHAYISIYGTEPDELPAPKINPSVWMTGIQLMFDDVDRDFDGYKMSLRMIQPHQADEIVRFVFDLHEMEKEVDLIVHCYAGVSRSAGVGKFVNDIFKLDLPNYNRLSLYNATVYQQLVSAWDRLVNPL